MDRLKGLLFVLCIFTIAGVGGLATLPLCLTFMILPYGLSLTIKSSNFALASFFAAFPGLLEVVFGIKVKVCGDLKKLQGPCLIIMNHRTRLDWMFLWCYLLRMGDLRKLKIILQKKLKTVPILGWGMQSLLFIFISRKWLADQGLMKKYLSYFVEMEFPLQLLIFPEGTDLSAHNKEKNHCYAEENGLQKYDYVLHPRTKGFCLCVEELRKGKLPLTIVNMSVGYVGRIPQNEIDMPLGNWPKEVHFFAEQIPLTKLPQDEQGLTQWVAQCWAQKEAQLKDFHENKKFYANYRTAEQDRPSHRYAVCALLMWTTVLLFIAYNFLTNWFFWYYYPLAVAFYFVVNWTTDGVDSIMLKRHYLFHD